MTHNSLSATKNKRLLFKVVKTNWTHNNNHFLIRELLDSGAKAVETLTEAEGTVTEAAVVIVTGQVETLAEQ